MSDPAVPLWAELRDPALTPVWAVVRRRLEVTGLEASGNVTVSLDHVAADLLGGTLGRRLRAGRRLLPLAAWTRRCGAPPWRRHWRTW
ncbi:hypothetical protein [Geodermatophilus sp. DF01-2]|uniref:hypothetical protein n=1 Tax=Geodermatophilus sp. DF01-2 TaxID=2559610 RepID=UPI001FD742B6|nr:hypothetical protein [Geodermatophilus sp. DF01_2]